MDEATVAKATECDMTVSLGETMDTETVFRAYVTCALWSSTDEDGEPLDGAYTIDDLADDASDTMREDVENFLELAGPHLAGLEPAQVGHDFWLTRNHHGAGFWDRGLGEQGEQLTKDAQSFGSQDLYVGDDGLIYVM